MTNTTILTLGAFIAAYSYIGYRFTQSLKRADAKFDAYDLSDPEYIEHKEDGLTPAERQSVDRFIQVICGILWPLVMIAMLLATYDLLDPIINAIRKVINLFKRSSR